VKFLIPINQKVFRDFRLFVVPVLIENRGRSLYLPMILDTAASYVTVRPDVFGQLDIHPLRKHALVTASEQTTAPMGQVDRITIGSGCTATRVSVISIALPPALPAEGLLGASFLRNFQLSLDYSAGTLELNTK
jgi:predicted aspartyl protease